MNKIVGFTVSKIRIDHNDIDVFNRGLKLVEFLKCGFYIYLWGINEVEECKINEKYTLSFPVDENLLDRNVLIYFEDENIIIENDWLGSIPVFYNENGLIISTLSLKTLKTKDIHPEGLRNFVEFGYSVLEQTPFVEVKFMRYFSKLIVNTHGITYVYKEDPALKEENFIHTKDEKIVFEKIKKYIRNVEESTKDEIIIPTSGGYDSRLLNLCIKNKSRIRSYAYGISDNQSESSEVVQAKKVSEILKTKFEQIELTDYNRYMDHWFKIYGISTHLHGMYHIEFYKKISESHSFGKSVSLLSGIIGDGWSGNVTVDRISNFNEISKLGYSHGANADETQLLIPFGEDLKRIFFEKHQHYLKNEKIRIIFLLRFKLILLSYLIIIPEYFGFTVWTPFLNFEIALSMLNISIERRNGRAWQRELFRQYSLDIEGMNLKKDNSNSLNYQAYLAHIFEKLDVELLCKYFNKKYLEDINEKMLGKPSRLKLNLNKLNNHLIATKYIRSVLRLLGITYSNLKDILIVFPYYVINTIERGLKA